MSTSSTPKAAAGLKCLRSKVCDECGDAENCCWKKALAVRCFKKRVFNKYILAVTFDLVVSVVSVITDLVSVGMYMRSKKWVIALATAIPVLLPTVVFTNVFLADETQGYCKLPKRGRKGKVGEHPKHDGSDKSSSDLSTSTIVTDVEVVEPQSISSSASNLNHPGTHCQTKEEQWNQFHDRVDFHCGTCHLLCSSCSGCLCGTVRSICYKDEKVRQSAATSARKSVKRLWKYLFGTIVLRYIALAWYAKALLFGVKAYREPKKYMNIAPPDSHWSYDLLVKLDFLQAALENAPQCIIQLYVLLIYSDENPILGIATVLFSFMDFVRISISVQWDVQRGPIIAPHGCYKTLMWKLINCLSWVFLYVGRSCALGLIMATAHTTNWVISVPVTIIVLHFIVFTKLFYKAKYGVAAQKVFVSVFISVFFLPEFDTVGALPILTQLYYAIIHIENLFFVVPWNGLEFDYCFETFRVGNKDNLNPDRALGSVAEATCIIDPVVIVIGVPAFTMIGIIMRLAASKKMSEYKKTIPKRTESMDMEEHIAQLYRKKWTSMTFDTVVKAFFKMLKSEKAVQQQQPETETNAAQSRKSSCNNNKKSSVFFLSTTPAVSDATKQLLQQTLSCFSEPVVGVQGNNGIEETEGARVKTKRSLSIDACGLYFRGGRMRKSASTESDNGHDDEGKRKTKGNNFLQAAFDNTFSGKIRSKSQDNVNRKSQRNCIDKRMDMDMDIQFVKINGPDTQYIMGMTWV